MCFSPFSPTWSFKMYLLCRLTALSCFLVITKCKAQVSGSCLCSSIMFMFKNSACTGTESAVQKCIGVGSVYLYLSTCAPYQSSEAAFGFLMCGFGCWSAKVTSKKNVETWLQLNTFMQGVKLACTWSTNTAWASRRACIQTWSCTGGAYKSLHAHRTTSSEHHMWWIPSTHHWLDLHVSWWSVNAFQRPRGPRFSPEITGTGTDMWCRAYALERVNSQARLQAITYFDIQRLWMYPWSPTKSSDRRVLKILQAQGHRASPTVRNGYWK